LVPNQAQLLTIDEKEVLDSIFLKEDISDGMTIEMERFLVEVGQVLVEHSARSSQIPSPCTPPLKKRKIQQLSFTSNETSPNPITSTQPLQERTIRKRTSKKIQKLLFSYNISNCIFSFV
jgi:hypothetical protein